MISPPSAERVPEAARRPARALVSCEHAGNEVPEEYQDAFHAPPAVLASHRGIDMGSLDYGRDLSVRLGATLLAERVTRLLVDTNRSDDHPERLSEFSRAMPAALQERACREIWSPHRARVAAAVEAAVREGERVVHFSAHSFTPIWATVERTVDIGILFDPGRTGETDLANALQGEFEARLPGLRIRQNEPYLGIEDGLTRTLRGIHGDEAYAGLELEVSQRFPLDSTPEGAALWKTLRAELAEAVAVCLGR